MKKAKITSDGKLMTEDKTVQLTEEQLDMLGIKIRKNPFKRVGRKYYFFIKDFDGKPYATIDCRGIFDNTTYNNVNYFNDEDFANQVALHQLLYRKLLKFAWDNEAEDTPEWNVKNEYYGIAYDCENHKFVLEVAHIYKSYGVHFSSSKVAERAIKEVIEPFQKEHPEFVW